jgi:DNA-binding CsgD family transcriptional regulator
MDTSQAVSDVEFLSSCLLKLGRVAREVSATEFLFQGVDLVRETISCPSAWWGLAFDRGPGNLADILQADFIGLPDTLVADFRKIATSDPLSLILMECKGQVQRFAVDEHRDKNMPVTIDFADRYGIKHAMGLCLDEDALGQLFFIVMYRGEGDAAFSNQEAVLFQQLIRHIVQLWHFSLQDALSKQSIGDIIRVALARPDGHLLYAGPELCELVYANWPDWDGITLPDDLVASFASLPCRVRLAEGTIDLSNVGGQIQLVRVQPNVETSLLSPREQRAAHLFAAGLTYKEISRQLSLTPATVRSYLRNAYLRLGVNNKVQLSNVLNAKLQR